MLRTAVGSTVTLIGMRCATEGCSGTMYARPVYTPYPGSAYCPVCELWMPVPGNVIRDAVTKRQRAQDEAEESGEILDAIISEDDLWKFVEAESALLRERYEKPETD